LLRKRAQLRRRASASELLEVGCDARAHDVRRALRRLAKHVHPDALGPSAPASLREASSELMRALLQAEHELRPIRARAR
jgi:DnaJ-class molecular chaperone